MLDFRQVGGGFAIGVIVTIVFGMILFAYWWNKMEREGRGY